MEMTLNEVKRVIRVVSSNEKLNAKVMRDLQKEDDCFGREFLDDSEECKICQVLTEVGDRRAALSIFCRELMPKVESEEKEVTEEVAPEEKKILSELKSSENAEKLKKIQKTKLDIGPGGIEAFINKMLDDGTSDDEIKKSAIQLYVSAGRDEKYAKVKAGFWLSYTKGRRKKGIFVRGGE